MQACRVCRIASLSVGLGRSGANRKLPALFDNSRLKTVKAFPVLDARLSFSTLADSKEEEYDWDPKNEDDSIASSSSK